MLLLYHDTLLNLLLGDHLFIITYHLWIRKKYFYMPLFFSNNIVPASAPGTILKGKVDSIQPCFLCGLCGITSSSSPFIVIRLWIFLYIPLLCWTRLPQSHSLLEFYHEESLDFVKDFFYIYWIHHMFFVIKFIK